MTKKLLKKPLLVNCFKCNQSLAVKFNPGQGKYVVKNNWGYWTNQKTNQHKYICDACLVYLYKKDRWTYLENITDLGRRVLRTYIYDQTLRS